jgi:hypothetical protein
MTTISLMRCATSGDATPCRRDDRARWGEADLPTEEAVLPFGPLGNIGGDHGRMERGSGRQRHQRRRDRHTRFRECLARLRPEIIVLEAATARVRHHSHPMASATSAGASQTSQVARTLTVRARFREDYTPTQQSGRRTKARGKRYYWSPSKTLATMR